ncbi:MULTISPECIES: hypothetical protein, partial [unclassified Caballeronia]
AEAERAESCDVQNSALSGLAQNCPTLRGQFIADAGFFVLRSGARQRQSAQSESLIAQVIKSRYSF